MQMHWRDGEMALLGMAFLHCMIEITCITANKKDFSFTNFGTGTLFASVEYC